MNKKYILRIPIKDSDKKLSISANLMLDPYYISETAILSAYVEEQDYDKYLPKAREIIYNSSLRALEFVTRVLGTTLPESYLILYKRELALCFAMESFGNHYYNGYTESLSRSKSYGEFSVSTTVKNGTNLVNSRIQGAKDCIDGIKQEIKNLADMNNGLGLFNVKGIDNSSNPLSFRLWFHNNLPERSKEIFASGKVWYHGNIYKEGKNVSNAGIENRGRAERSSIYDDRL